MDEPTPYQPDEDDVLVHRANVDDWSDAYFAVGINFGVGLPHYYVSLDENGGERS